MEISALLVLLVIAGENVRISEMGTFLERADAAHQACRPGLQPLEAYSNRGRFADDFFECVSELQDGPSQIEPADISSHTDLLGASRWTQFSQTPDTVEAITPVTTGELDLVAASCGTSPSLVPAFAAHSLKGRAVFHGQNDIQRAILAACYSPMREIEHLFRFGCENRTAQCGSIGALMIGAYLIEFDLRYRRSRAETENLLEREPE